MMMVGKHVFVVLSVLYLKPAASAFNSPTIIRCIEKEREALLLFKQGLVDEYERLSSWGSTEDCCKWSGIMCSNMTSHVTLDLSNANLRGKISPSLLELQHLNYLDLSSNDFNGTIPRQLRNLTKLQHLDLSTANYGSITVNGNLEWLSYLSSLTFLDMSGINLSKAIDWLQAINMLPSLSELHLFGCELSNVVPLPSSLSFVNSTTSLAILDLSYNHLQGSLPDMKRFSALWQLDLSQNRLTGFSNKNFGLPSALFVMYLEDNQMGGLLPDLTDMSSLTDLYLANNQLHGTLPESMGQLSKLEYLDVSNNFLKGNISEPHFSNLSKLKLLDLSFNSLSFDLSSHWVPLFQLDEIKLSGCKLGPHFPKWLRTQIYFSYIDISNSKISDSIPNWFWDLSTRLYHLNLSSNQISGKLPNLLCLSTLDLSSNHLDGPIPLFSSNLTSLDLSNNRFLGPISSLCAITGEALTFIDLSRNLLAGGLPDCWMQFERLVVLNLANNNLFGKIPNSIGSLDLIETLHLGNNSFSGELPSSLKKCTLLNLLDLGENKFFGKIPAWIGKSLSLLIVLSLPSNEFYGTIPLHLCHLKYIQILDLSQNNISGTIPHCLKNFTAMSQKEYTLPPYKYSDKFGRIIVQKFEYVGSVVVFWKRLQQEYRSQLNLVKMIDLSANKLAGEIPEEIANLVELVALNLSRNNLSGKITPKIGKLKMLNFLDLSQNQLFGEIPASLSNLDSLGVLDFSNNSLSGKIPVSLHLQTFDASSYMGNPDLCGPPLPNKCPGDETTQDPPVIGGREDANIQEKEDRLITPGFYVSMALGFIIGFWGVCGSLFFISSWRYAYFRFLNNMTDWLYVKIAVNKAKLHRRLGG